MSRLGLCRLRRAAVRKRCWQAARARRRCLEFSLGDGWGLWGALKTPNFFRLKWHNPNEGAEKVMGMIVCTYEQHL